MGLIFSRYHKAFQKPIANKDQYGRLSVAAAVGVTPDVGDRVAALQEGRCRRRMLDTAHGHTMLPKC